jgi:DNA-binding HxlR family transcriptional regulator
LTNADAKGRRGGGARTGALALSLVAAPLNISVLQVLASGPSSLIELRGAVGAPPTTLRGHLRELTALGLIEQHRQAAFPGKVDYDLTERGKDLSRFTDVVASWLAESPRGALTLGSDGAKSALKALTEGWSTKLVRALAAKPLALTELASLFSELSYPSLERRLTAMKLAGQLETRAANSRGRPYFVTEWLRRATGTLLAASRWERRNLAAETPPMVGLDVEAVLLLAAPMLAPAPEARGSCRLAVQVQNGQPAQFAGAIVTVESGGVSSCSTKLRGDTDAWVSGSAAAWLEALIGGDVECLEIGGDCSLGVELVIGLHDALFAPVKLP